MPRLGLSAALTLLVTATAAPAAAGDLLRFEEVAQGVWAALQPAEASQNDCNSVVLINDRDVVVIDAPSDPAAVAEVIEEIAELTSLPIRYVINTHWHSDHTQGNQVYRERLGDAVAIVGHQTLLADVPERAGGYVDDQAERLRELIPRAERQLEQGLSLGGEPLTDGQQVEQRAGIEGAKVQLERFENADLLPPDVAYDTSLTFERGERTIRLLHFVGHTRGDTVVYLPSEGVLVTGDLLDEMPYAGHGYPESWLEALAALGELEFSIVVPGHGPIFRGGAQRALLEEYLRTLVAHARSSVAAGRTLEESRSSLDLGPFRQRLAGESAILQRTFDAYASEAVARAFAEASGDPLD